jgi:hypothetical protein
MTTERDIEKLQEQVLALRDDVTALKTWRDNQQVNKASTPAWLFGVLSVCVAAASLLINILLAGGR